jgi:hypothetical protein
VKNSFSTCCIVDPGTLGRFHLTLEIHFFPWCTKSVTGVVVLRSKWAAGKAVRGGLAVGRSISSPFDAGHEQATARRMHRYVIEE